MSSDQDFIDAIAVSRGEETDQEGGCPYVIQSFPDGVLFTSTGGIHEGRMEALLAEHDETGAVWASEEGVYCMLIRTDDTSEVVFGIRDNLTENDAEDEHIHEDDLSHVYDSIDDYISETGAVGNGADVNEVDDYGSDRWDDEEEDELEDDEPDWDDQGENY